MSKAVKSKPRVRAQYLLSPRTVERIKIRAARERTLPNRLVERLLDEALKDAN